MSYKDYSTEAVKEIMNKVSEYQKNGQDADSPKLPVSDHKRLDQNSKIVSGGIKDYEYNHPTNAEVNRITNTHIFIEKWFESKLSEETVWKEIQSILEDSFTVDESLGKLEEYSAQKKWKRTNHSNHELIVSLKKDRRFASLKIIQRVGFWSAAIDGILHGSYISLIMFGIIFGIFRPSLPLSVGVLALLWPIIAFIIYRFSISSRNKKQEHLINLSNKLIAPFALHSESNYLSGAGNDSNRNLSGQ